MTVKERFKKLICRNFTINQLEKVADDYAIEFAEWLGVNNYKKYSNGWANMFTKATREKELLEIFKKEKQL